MNPLSTGDLGVEVAEILLLMQLGHISQDLSAVNFSMFSTLNDN